MNNFLKIIYITALIFAAPVFAFAQSNTDTSPVISTENIENFSSIARLDFQSLDANFLSGWFVMNAAGTHFAVRTADDTVWVLDENGDLLVDPIIIDESGDFPAQLVDAVFAADGLTLIFDDGEQIYRVHDKLDVSSSQRNMQILNLDATILSIWKDCDEISCQTWLEILPDDPQIPPSVAQLDDTGTIIAQIPYAPVQDDTAQLRVGRVALPYVVTSSGDGLVKLWNVQTGDIINSVQQPEIVPFGNINAAADTLIWRDNANNILSALNFNTGDNQQITDLQGQYAQWLFITPAADLAFAINLEFEPLIIAWDVNTGTEIFRQPYRYCERLPDMARLSVDGTTLVIGCDTGLEIWRIVD